MLHHPARRRARAVSGGAAAQRGPARGSEVTKKAYRSHYYRILSDMRRSANAGTKAKGARGANRPVQQKLGPLLEDHLHLGVQILAVLVQHHVVSRSAERGMCKRLGQMKTGETWAGTNIAIRVKFTDRALQS